jgi:hypothetical protein
MAHVPSALILMRAHRVPARRDPKTALVLHPFEAGLRHPGEKVSSMWLR